MLRCAVPVSTWTDRGNQHRNSERVLAAVPEQGRRLWGRKARRVSRR